MKIICAGLAKTGTKSLAAALRILGFTVHDFIEHFDYHMDEYLEALDGKMPDFFTMYKNVDAITDNPACLFWKELHESFPKAKVILTERDSVEAWLDSNIAYGNLTLILMKRAFQVEMLLTPTGRKIETLVRKYLRRYSDNQMDKISPVYLEHNSQVKATIPQDHLLVFNVKQGWKPLCEFLGVDVPDVPFPKLNKRENTEKEMESMFKQSQFGRRLRRELVFVMTFVIVVFGILLYMTCNSYVHNSQ